MKRGIGWLVVCLVMVSLSASAGDGQEAEGKGARKEQHRERQEAHQQHREAMQKERKSHFEAMKAKRKAFRETMKGMEPQQAAQALHGFLQGMFAENNAFFEAQHEKRNAFFKQTVSGEKEAGKREEHLERMNKHHEAITTHRKSEQEKTLSLLQELAGNPELTRKGLHEALRKRRQERKEATRALSESLGEVRIGGRDGKDGESKDAGRGRIRRPERADADMDTDDPDDFSDLLQD